MTRGRAWALAAVILSGAAAGRLEAQEAVQCSVEPRPTTRFTSFQLPSGQHNFFFGGGGIPMRCPARGLSLVADSIESYGDEQRVILIGNVDYREPRLAVTADLVTYFMVDERVVATGRVVATLPSGSKLRGPLVEYRRAVPRVRAIAELEALSRPTITILPEQQGAPPTGAQRNRDTTVVTGNRIFMRGDSLLYASGQVDIARPDFSAAGDSVFMDTQTEYMRLMRTPSIVGKGERPFRLTGELIDLYSANRRLDQVIARGAGRAVSEDMTLTADTIQFRVANDLLQAAAAWGRTRQAEAVSPTQRITADSIDVVMPEQRPRRIAAVGTAYAEATPDTVRFETTEKDWLRGNTIFAWFDSTAASVRDSVAAGRDTVAARRPPSAVSDTATRSDSAATTIRELLAVGAARSYQHLPPQNSAAACPAINYVRGDSIRVAFDSGAVRTVRVVSATTSPGILAEPDSTCGPRSATADTTAATPPAGTAAPAPRSGTPAPSPTSPRTSAPVLPAPPARPQPSRP